MSDALKPEEGGPSKEASDSILTPRRLPEKCGDDCGKSALMPSRKWSAGSTEAPSPYMEPSSSPLLRERADDDWETIPTCGEYLLIADTVCHEDLAGGVDHLMTHQKTAGDLCTMVPAKLASFVASTSLDDSNCLESSTSRKAAPLPWSADAGALKTSIPPEAPRRGRRPPLMRALQAKCALAVRAALAAEPDAAAFPFWEHQLEPPLCHAIRAGCAADVCTLLLQHGADVNAEDMKGRTPMDLLEEERLSREKLTHQWQFPFLGANEHPCMACTCLDAVEKVLAEAGGRRHQEVELSRGAHELFPQLPRFPVGKLYGVKTSLKAANDRVWQTSPVMK